MTDLAPLLLTHAAVTCAMTGLIWFVQIVHYPLMGEVGTAGFPAYALRHQKLTTCVVAPLMLIEAATALVILWAWRDDPIRLPQALVATGLLAVIWVSTFLVQVPQHRRLALGFDRATHRQLVRWNWARTVAWTIRAAVVVIWAA